MLPPLGRALVQSLLPCQPRRRFPSGAAVGPPSKAALRAPCRPLKPAPDAQPLPFSPPPFVGLRPLQPEVADLARRAATAASDAEAASAQDALVIAEVELQVGVPTHFCLLFIFPCVGEARGQRLSCPAPSPGGAIAVLSAKSLQWLVHLVQWQWGVLLPISADYQGGATAAVRPRWQAEGAGSRQEGSPTHRGISNA